VRSHKFFNRATFTTKTAVMSGIFAWSPFSRTQSNASSDRETIELKHGKQSYQLTFKTGVLSSLPVSELKSLARQEAHLDDEVEIKLLFQGRRMDDKEVVGKYQVQDGSRILMTSSKKIEKPVSATPTATGTSTPQAQSTPPPKAVAPQTPLDKIAAIRSGIKETYGPQVTAFTRNPPNTRKERAETKAKLSELLLQQLLKFDDVVIDPDDFASKEARLERKAAVRWVQGLMDDVDRVDLDATQ
jgi:hypothetical protein